MKFDTAVLFPTLANIAELAQAAEAIGFDGLWASETNTDPFLPLTLAAEHTHKIEIGTGIAVAFPRSPTTLAYLAWDLARFSGGRFILGLGSQVRAHNERRFGVAWEKPVRKMRETIEALHAIWDTWETGKPLDYRGEFFQLDLMTPFFSTGPLGFRRPPVYIAAVNELMLRLAGKLCDGVFIHAFHTADYLRDYALPNLEQGLAQAGREREELAVMTAVFVVPTDDAKPASAHEQFARQQISFYMSTPAYRTITELHGWRETAFRLSKMARRGEWEQMPNEITDDMLDTMALSGKWAELPHKVSQRYGEMLDRVSFYLPFVPGESDVGWRTAVSAFAQKAS